MWSLKTTEGAVVMRSRSYSPFQPVADHFEVQQAEEAAAITDCP